MEKASKPLNRDAIKYIAMFTMLLNHISLIFLKPDSILGIAFRNIGYFTAVTMCYFLVEGYKYTRSKKQYALRLLLIAIPAQIPFVLAFEEYLFGYLPLNMLFTLFLSFIILVVKDKIKNEFIKSISILFLIIFASICDWSIMAPIFVLFFAWAKDDSNKKLIAFIISALIFAFMNYPIDGLLVILGVAAMLSAGFVIVYLYNGKRMEKYQQFSKWFFYIFYPGHLMILYLIKIFVV